MLLHFALLLHFAAEQSFVGFHMARDDRARLRRSWSATSRSKKASSARQEVDL